MFKRRLNTLNSTDIFSPLRNQYDNLVHTISGNPFKRNNFFAQTPPPRKKFRLFRCWSKSKRSSSDNIKSQKQKRREKRDEAKLKKLRAKEEKLFKKKLVTEIEQFDKNKKNSAGQLSKSYPVIIKESSPLAESKKASSNKPKKLKTTPTQYDSKIESKWEARKKVLAIDSGNDGKSKLSFLSKSKRKKEEEDKRQSNPTFSERFVNCFYRTCCQIYCFFTITLLVGLCIILFIPLP